MGGHGQHHAPRALSPLKIKIPIKMLGRQRCSEGFSFGVKDLTNLSIAPSFLSLNPFSFLCYFLKVSINPYS
jgi:hypothetical protein